MLHHESQLNISADSPLEHYRVSAEMLLSDLIDQPDLLRHPFLFVVDEQGIPLGIVSTSDLRDRLNSENAAERRQWLSMPVEAAMHNRIQAPVGGAGIVDAVPSRCTVISEGGSLLAVVTEDDLLISWKSIERTLRRSQADSVTGLPTRTAFEQHLKAECNRGARCGHSVAAILIDMDHFKAINDRFGHAAGDHALQTVGQALRQTLRSYDMVARYGGDEFAAICCGCRPGEIEVTIRKIHDCLKQLHSSVATEYPIPTLSIGACVVHDFSLISGPDEIVEQADECLYVAKRSGRDCSFTTEVGAELLNTIPHDRTPLQTGDNHSHADRMDELGPQPAHR